MLNNVRRPAVRAVLNGTELAGVISAEIDSNNHLSADRYRVRFAAQVVRLDALQTPGGRLEILFGIDGAWTSVIVGIVDAVHYDPVAGVVDAEGRDLAALLIEAQTDETFSNRTASEVATLLASRHQLQAKVDDGGGAVGRFYQSERDRTTLGQFARTITEWDLLANLAGQKGFDLYVQGTTLRFGAPDGSAVYVLSPSDCIDLRLEHCVALARPMAVSVKSWSARTGQVTTATSEAPGDGPLWSRAIVRPNLTPDDAQQLAARTIADVRRHEWSAHVVMPGELTISPRSRVQLTGTRTAWDRSYGVSQVHRSLDARGGFRQTLQLQGAA